MTEDEAKEWTFQRFGGNALERIGRFLALVEQENARQNLISPSTVGEIWVRHAVDSAQLMRWDNGGAWLDIGSGAGFPGMVIALLRMEPVVLSEPRRRRADFLQHCCEALRLTHVRIAAQAVEKLHGTFDVISARAVASIEKLLQIGRGVAKADSRWVLPRGHIEPTELHALGQTWPGVFHVEQSITDAKSAILVLDGVQAR